MVYPFIPLFLGFQPSKLVQEFFHPQYGVWFATQKKEVQLLLSRGQHSISTAILEQSISHLSFKSLAAWWLLGVFPPNTLGSITIQRRNQVEQPVYKDDRRFWTLIYNLILLFTDFDPCQFGYPSWGQRWACHVLPMARHNSNMWQPVYGPGKFCASFQEFPTKIKLPKIRQQSTFIIPWYSMSNLWIHSAPKNVSQCPGCFEWVAQSWKSQSGDLAIEGRCVLVNSSFCCWKNTSSYRWTMFIMILMTAWWFQTWLEFFHHIWDVILPIDID